MLLMLCLTGLTQIGFAQQHPTKGKLATTGYLRGPITVENITTFGPGFLGHDIRTVIASFPEPKTEFETTDQYQNRLDSFIAQHQQQYVFVNDPKEDNHEDMGDFKYDADDEAIYRTIKLSSVDGRSILLRSKLIDRGSYVGSNAFGVRKIVTKLDQTNYELSVTTRSEVFVDDDLSFEGSYPYRPAVHNDLIWLIKIKVPMIASEAAASRNYLRIALVCTLVGSDIVHTDTYRGATITDPTEVHWHDRGLPVVINKVLIFDSRTGHIQPTAKWN
jgi:hypothetical protein